MTIANTEFRFFGNPTRQKENEQLIVFFILWRLCANFEEPIEIGRLRNAFGFCIPTLLANNVHLDFFHSLNASGFPTFDYHLGEAMELHIIINAPDAEEDSFVFSPSANLILMRQYMLLSPGDEEHKLLGAMAHIVLLAYKNKENFALEMRRIFPTYIPH